jgi:DNA invertase Pin-like site-specific DNA recombinase
MLPFFGIMLAGIHGKETAMGTVTEKAVSGAVVSVVGYVRLSKDRGEEQAAGPEVQRRAIAAWCKENGHALVAVHEDLGVSGAAAIEARPGLLAALDDVRDHGARFLLVHRRDRLGRDVLVCAMTEKLLSKMGADVVAADGHGNDPGPEGELMRRILDAFSAYERACIRLRIRRALAVKVSQGVRLGQPPLGQRRISKTEFADDPAELATVALVHECASAGMSLRAIAAVLEARGIRTRTGREKWQPKVIASIVRRAA